MMHVNVAYIFPPSGVALILSILFLLCRLLVHEA